MEVETTRVMEAKKVEPMVLRFVGSALLMVAGFFVWQELHVESEVLVIVGAVLTALIAWFTSRKGVALVGPLLLAATSGVAGFWYAANKEPVLLIAMGLAFAASMALALASLKERRRDNAGDRLHRMVTWIAMAGSGIIGSFAAYFQIFDASESNGLGDFVARRAILSLFWLTSGTALVLFGRLRQATEARDAGFVVLAAAVAKLMIYDTTHTDGVVRIAALAIGGAVLLGASFIGRRQWVQS